MCFHKKLPLRFFSQLWKSIYTTSVFLERERKGGERKGGERERGWCNVRSVREEVRGWEELFFALRARARGAPHGLWLVNIAGLISFVSVNQKTKLHVTCCDRCQEGFPCGGLECKAGTTEFPPPHRNFFSSLFAFLTPTSLQSPNYGWLVIKITPRSFKICAFCFFGSQNFNSITFVF